MSHNDLVLIPLWYAVFLLSLTCHEAAHAFMAYRGGDPTAYAGGQVTLNPLPHIQREPFGTIVIPLITFVSMGWMMGWASAPYDPLWEDRHPRRAAAMAAAGPAANAILALMALLALKARGRDQLNSPPSVLKTCRTRNGSDEPRKPARSPALMRSFAVPSGPALTVRRMRPPSSSA